MANRYLDGAGKEVEGPRSPHTERPREARVSGTWSSSGPTGTCSGGSPDRTPRGRPTANLTSSMGTDSAPVPGRRLKKEEEERKAGTSPPPLKETCSNFPGSQFYPFSPPSGTFQLAPAGVHLLKLCIPGSEIGSNCVWQIHSPVICSRDMEQIAPSPQKTHTRKRREDRAASAKPSSRRRGPGDSGRTEGAREGRRACRQVWP